MSYTPMQLFIDWMTQYAITNDYTLTRGMWDETNTDMKKKYMSVWIDGGRSPYLEVTYPTVRMIVTGVRNGRATGDVESVEVAAHGIIDAANENWKTDCIASIIPLGNIQGPYYTETNRAWYEVNFQLII